MLLQSLELEMKTKSQTYSQFEEVFNSNFFYYDWAIIPILLRFEVFLLK